jgi:class 3 adenylate cyclase/tetratricopeptide (TPR) repeat protein
MPQLEEWLESIGLGKHIGLFRAQGIDLDVAGYLTQHDLAGMALSLGDQKRLMRAIAALGKGDAVSSPAPPTPGASAERRRLTIMFCDLVDSTAIAGRMDPEEVGKIITAYYDAVWRTVVRFGGHPARLIGDGVLVYFGWPRAHEDQVQSAVAAGLAVIEAVGGLEIEPGRPLQCRIGIATGPVVVGEIAGDGKAVDTVVGTAPNLAARIQAEASRQSMLIDEATFSELAGQFKVEPQPPLILKGFAERVRTWRVDKAMPSATRFSARTPRKLPLVGRDSELGLLKDGWRRAQHGQGRALLLSGEPGIGKSRLLEALIDAVAIEDSACIRLQCQTLHADTPLHPIVDQMRRALGFEPATEPPERRRRLEDYLDRSLGAAGDLAEVFSQLLGVPTTAGWSDRETPAARRRQIIEALVALMTKLADRRPLLVIVEDIQWSDPTTEQVVRALTERLAGAPILLAITAREPFAQDWFVGPQVGAMTLGRLDPWESAAMVRSVAAIGVDEAVVRRIADRGDGIPLFIEELTRYVVDAGRPADAPVAPIEGDLPGTLHAILNSRLDRLGPAKRIAQVGALIGRECPVPLLARVTGSTSETLEPGLEALVLAGLAERRGPAGMTLWFTHLLIQEAAYATLLLSDRRQLHTRVLEGYLSLFPDLVQQQPHVLAEHASRAEQWDKAAHFLGLAYANATRRSANREAISIFNRAVEVLGRLPRDAVATQAIDLRLHAFTAFHTVGANDKLLELIHEAERLANTIGDKHRLAAATAQMAFALWLDGKHADAERRAEQALALTQMPRDLPLVLSIKFNLANIHHAQGRIEQAVALHREVLSMLAGGLERKRLGWPAPPALFARAFASWYLLELGCFAEAAALLEEAEALVSPAEAHGRVMVDTGRGNLLMRRGAFNEAVEVLGATLDLCRRAEVLTMLPIVAAWLGHALCGAGRVDEALAVTTDAVDRETYKFGGKYTWIHLRLGLAEASRLGGRLEHAAAEAELAERIAKQCGEVVHMAYAGLERGRVSLARGDAELALQQAEEALQTASERGLPQLRADCFWLAGHAHARRGESAISSQAFARAREICTGLNLDDRVFATAVRSADRSAP